MKTHNSIDDKGEWYIELYLRNIGLELAQGGEGMRIILRVDGELERGGRCTLVYHRHYTRVGTRGC